MEFGNTFNLGNFVEASEHLASFCEASIREAAKKGSCLNGSAIKGGGGGGAFCL